MTMGVILCTRVREVLCFFKCGDVGQKRVACPVNLSMEDAAVAMVASVPTVAGSAALGLQ